MERAALSSRTGAIAGREAGRKAAQERGARLEFEWLDRGCDRYLKSGTMMPLEGSDILSGFDAVFLGCVGDATKVPDHISLGLLLTIRKGFDQYVNLRPVVLYPGVATPDEVAIQTSVFTRKGTERVIRYAFELARKRKGTGGGKHQGMVTNCSKSNALEYSMVLWDEVYNAVSEQYPDIQSDFALVDALTMWFIKDPERFDVVVASNLFGDIITDLGAMLQGGMGFAAGGNINPEKRHPSMFEPIHGSAPKYAGKGVVNPIASIEAMRMLLAHLELTDAATAIEEAVRSVLSQGTVRIKDMDGSASTEEMGDAVAGALVRTKTGAQGS